MNEHEAYDLIMKQLCKEAIQIAEQIQEHKTISVQDLDKIDKIYHAKKSMLTVKAMEDADEYSQTEGMSGRRGRGSDGRYISMNHGEGYSEGYDRGYSEGMRMSGHYPMPYYPNRY